MQNKYKVLFDFVNSSIKSHSFWIDIFAFLHDVVDRNKVFLLAVSKGLKLEIWDTNHQTSFNIDAFLTQNGFQNLF